MPLKHKLSKEHFRKVQMVFQDPYGSLPRYSIDTLQLSRFARERGACVLAITDSPVAPSNWRASG